MSAQESLQKPIKSFVLRSGRMSNAQKRAYTANGNRFLIPFSEKTPDWKQIFGNENTLTVEIGFGMGQATAQMAHNEPNVNFIGIEVFKAGIGKLLWEIGRLRLENIRIIEHDAVEVITKMFENESVNAFHLLFPDPWPKKKHHKRRLVKRPFTGLLAEKLAAGGYVYMATDWEDYAKSALEELEAAPGLQKGPVTSENSNGSRLIQRPLTKFELKGMHKQRSIHELLFKKSGAA
jgi:tRNA (guanine-N7-)-methyltransferase